jgi:hypothetical protein
MKIQITAGKISVNATLSDTPTARAIWDALPIEGIGQLWGEEIYFSIPVDVEGESDARAEVDVGDLGYWPPGHAFCIFFGRTPASTGDRPVAASPVNVMGQIDGDANAFASVPDGETVRLEALDENV